MHSIWQMEGCASYGSEQIIPKGVVELIFNFSPGTPILAEFGSKPFRLPCCFINGFNDVPVRISPPGQQVFFGVTLQPAAVKKILRTPASQFSNVPVDLTLIDPEFHLLWEQLAEQTGFEKRVEVFNSWIGKKTIEWEPREIMMGRFLSAVDQHDLTVPELAGALCYSSRHLSRKILEITGMNAEETLLYKKYLHAVHLMHHTDLPLTKVAYKSNFSDQSHFIRTFRSYTDLTPGEYRRMKGAQKGHIYGNVR
jgi:AraC-like DNA-binding protein